MHGHAAVRHPVVALPGPGAGLDTVLGFWSCWKKTDTPRILKRVEVMASSDETPLDGEDSHNASGTDASSESAEAMATDVAARLEVSGLEGEPDRDAPGVIEFLSTPGLAEWAQLASSAGLDWTKLRHEMKGARLVADATKQQTSYEFELEREKLKNLAAQAESEVARTRQEHAAELERMRLELKLKYQNDRVRSTVLLLVVLALVLMPMIAMFSPSSEIAPEDFAQFIAPVVGIAGTVLGYWFGKQESST
ncbi:hypothetical protein G7072_07860 [Nocardioides sp. HDW12B]|uniref:hypothetical protein n=1 Tax=Nocardioides sp. HDW12B TaxID=2714939 RepID=UPI00140DA19E|nr:hypothetical protein [Nocardioides sp. HDW12B]QIK66273.1 hypothetical protein G7072_07860 [Nocardioides sp. HDW12B]